MFAHPSTALFSSFMVISIIITSSTNSWFIAWLALEINMLSFIPLLLKSNNKYTTEAALKYFLIQTIPSLIIITLILTSASINQPYFIVMLTALFLKIGAAPLHQWIPSMIEGLLWKPILTLLTMQKMPPFILISFLLKMTSTLNLFVPHLFIAFSAIMGSIGGILQTSLRKIMAFSSITHTAWFITAMTLTNNLWLTYLVLYLMMMIPLIYMFNYLQSFTISDLLMKNKLLISVMLSLSIMSFSGLPPFTGFIPKLIVMQDLMLQNTFIPMILLTSTFLSLFFYARMFMSNILLMTSLNIWKTTPYPVNILLNSLNTLGLFLPSLMFTMM
uniref:NADH-ubiquinone oxidoreductase chain 2 n=1 Tax=Haploginglymus sp. JP-2016 TaxID=1867951 RepID=A0A330IXX0_9CRUS|nr:ND2 [Haploginglymus sp. JP-2016]